MLYVLHILLQLNLAVVGLQPAGSQGWQDRLPGGTVSITHPALSFCLGNVLFVTDVETEARKVVHPVDSESRPPTRAQTCRQPESGSTEGSQRCVSVCVCLTVRSNFSSLSLMIKLIKYFQDMV